METCAINGEANLVEGFKARGSLGPTGGAKEARTPNLVLARDAIYQLIYNPNKCWFRPDQQRPCPFPKCHAANPSSRGGCTKSFYLLNQQYVRVYHLPLDWYSK